MQPVFRRSLALVATLIAPVGLGAALAQQQVSRRPILISGSSTVYPIVQAGISAFARLQQARVSASALRKRAVLLVSGISAAAGLISAMLQGQLIPRN